MAELTDWTTLPYFLVVRAVWSFTPFQINMVLLGQLVKPIQIIVALELVIRNEILQFLPLSFGHRDS